MVQSARGSSAMTSRGAFGRRRGGGRYSIAVATLKLALPLLALVVTVAILAWPEMGGEEARISLKPAKVTAEDATMLRMANARFVGTDEQDRPFTITSAETNQASATAPTVFLTTPRADLTTRTGSWMVADAKQGIYARDKRQLDLAGDVMVLRDTGDEFRTAAASIDLVTGTAWGTDPVEGQGPSGHVTADGFKMIDRGERILFTGKARVVLRRVNPGS